MQAALFMLILAADPVGWDLSGNWVLESHNGSCDADHHALGRNTLEFKRTARMRGVEDGADPFSFTDVTYDVTYTALNLYQDDPCDPFVSGCSGVRLPPVFCAALPVAYEGTATLRRYDELRKGSRRRPRFELLISALRQPSFQFSSSEEFEATNLRFNSSERFEPFLDAAGQKIRIHFSSSGMVSGSLPNGCDGGYGPNDLHCRQFNRPLLTFVRGEATDGYFPKGQITGQVLSAVDQSPIPQATVTAYELVERVRDQNAGESDDDYDLYVSGVLSRSTRVAEAPVAGDGEFVLTNIPVFTPRVRSTRATYGLFVQSGRQMEMQGGQTIDVFFAAKIEPNVLAGERHIIALDPITELTQKSRLINKLTAQGPVQYAPVEAIAFNHLVSLTTGSAPTDEQLEGVKRAVWAEQVVYDGSSYARTALKEMIMGFADILALIVDKLSSGGDEKIKAAKMKIEKLENDGFDQLTTRFSSFSRKDLAQTRSQIEAIYKKNIPLQKQRYAKWIKRFLKLGVFDPWSRRVTSPNDKAIITRLASLTNAILDLTIVSDAKGLKTTLVKEIIKAFADEFFDNRFETLSFTGQNKDLLTFTNTQMIGWSVDNRDTFLFDINRTNLVLRELYELGPRRIGELEYIKATSKSLTEISEALSYLPPNPYAKNAELSSKIGAALASFAQAGGAVYFVFGELPPIMDRGVYAAFGQFPPQSMVVSSSPVDPDQSISVSALTEIEAWRTQFYDPLTAAIEQDDLLTALDVFETRDIETLDRDVDRLQLQFAAVASPSIDIDFLHNRVKNYNQSASDFRLAASAVETLLIGLVLDVVSEDLRPDSAVYLARREHLLRSMASAQDGLSALKESVEDAQAELQLRQIFPSAIVDSVTVVSNATQQAQLASPGEAFTVTAVIRNLSMASINLAATASVTGGNDFSLDSTTAPAGKLAAGAERTVTWTMTHSGASLLEAPVGTVQVELTEVSGDPPTAFFSEPGGGLVEVAPEAIDTDEDDLADTFEQRYGLMIGTDDKDADPDSDGLTNFDEQERGTHPMMADSDGDGLNDLEEETLGVDGVVTDPNNPDTDGDGEDDSADAFPTSLLNMGAPREEPNIAAIPPASVITPGQPDLQITINNGGQGELIWTAITDQPALVQVAPSYPASSRSDELSVSLTSGFTPTEPVAVTISVVDLAGSESDSQQFVVMVGPDGTTIPDGGVGADGGPGADGGSNSDGGSNADAGVGGPDTGSSDGNDEGCGCCQTSTPTAPAWLLFVALAAVYRRRR